MHTIFISKGWCVIHPLFSRLEPFHCFWTYSGLSHADCDSTGITPKFRQFLRCGNAPLHPLHTAGRSVSASLGFAGLNQTVGWVRGAPCCFCNLSLYLYSLKYLSWVWATRIVQNSVPAVCSLVLCPPALTFLQLCRRYDRRILGWTFHITISDLI